ncbi:TPA: hypothetical protein R1X42_000732 [Campylobacter upsaliensis]|nr:hypothetical protein [Campylobacter upsaliensis]
MAAGQGQARSSKVKQGQARRRGGGGSRVRSLKCDGKLALSGRANLAKWCGKFTPNGTANSRQKSFF